MTQGERDALTVFDDAWRRSSEAQTSRNNIYERVWQRYKGYNPSIADPYRSNIVMPKLYSTIETIVPRLSKALFGRRPYIPLTGSTVPEMAMVIQEVLDHYLYQDNFRVKGIAMLKGVSLFGTWFLEPYPDYEEVTTVGVGGLNKYPWVPQPVQQTDARFRLRVRQWAPWQVYVEPNMVDLDDPGYAITVEKCAVSEIKRLIEAGRYQPIEENYLNSGDDQKDFAISMMKSLGISMPSENDAYGVLCKYRHRDRYITLWNGLAILEDRENYYDKPDGSRKLPHGGTNLARFVYNLDPMLQNSFWGQGEGKALEIICDKLDETWNLLFDNHDIISQAVVTYRENAVSAESIVIDGGVRIEVKSSWLGSLDDAVKRLDLGTMPPEAYTIPEALDNWADRVSGTWDIQRGETASQGDPSKTATESSLLSTQGDFRSELRTELLESLGMADFADLCCHHIDAFAGHSDIARVIGPERAMLVFSMYPQEMPGGATYEFKGSDTVVNDFQKRADWAQCLAVIKDSPVARPGGVERETLTLYGKNEDEINKVILTQEEIQQVAEQQLAYDSAVRKEENEQKTNGKAGRGGKLKGAPTAQKGGK